MTLRAIAGALLLAGLLQMPVCSMAASQDAPIAEIGDGKLAGTRIDGVDRFLGIPYAAPPIGELRWRAPSAAAAWQGVFQAEHFGNDCIQNGIKYEGAPATSENCLYLNLWRPATHHRRLPVMVYIYGGGFNIGSGAWPMVDGASLARRGVVLVNFNYRLGKLGYFVHPALEAGAGHVGNFGLLDQVAALKWVKKNIAAFGGDPANVTIFGESTGGTAVEYLMASPSARGLFGRAIVESSIGNLPTPSFEEARDLGITAAKGWGVTGDDAAALRRVPAATVLGKATMTEGGATPILDDILPVHPLDAIRQGRAAHVDFMIGSNKDEAGFFPDASRGLSQKLAPVWPQVTKLYDGFGSGDTRAVEDELLTDLMIGAPAASMATAAANAGLPTYMYHYDYLRPGEIGHVPGPIHFDEIYAVFDTMQAVVTKDGPAPQPSTADTRRIVDAVQSRWVQFARTGRPDGWPAFTPKESDVLVFDAAGNAEIGKLPTARYDFIGSLPPMPTPKPGG